MVRRDAELVGGPHGDDSGHGGRLGGVDRPDRAVGDLGTDEHCVQHVVEPQVGDVPGDTGEQPRILGAQHTRAEQGTTRAGEGGGSVEGDMAEPNLIRRRQGRRCTGSVASCLPSLGP